jgi:hypothetical protein
VGVLTFSSETIVALFMRKVPENDTRVDNAAELTSKMEEGNKDHR